MTEEQEVEQTPEQDAADFEAGFNSVSDGESSPDVDTSEQTVTEAKTEDKPGAEAEDEEVKHFGFSEEQIKSLLERSTKVDSIEDQLRKAYGKIGELNSTLQSLVEKQNKLTATTTSQSSDSDVDEMEEAYPEFRDIADRRARKIASEIMAEYAGKTAEATPGVTKDEIIREANIAIMDANYDGWRDKLASQDFALWIATQPETVQNTFSTTVSARELGKIVKDFDGWKTKTSDRGNKNKQRLEGALVPESNASKVSHAISDHDAFVSGFKSVHQVM